MDEIREYEEQLAEIRKAGANEELKQLESEIVSLIAELRSNLPKFAKGDEVASKKLRGRIVECLGQKMYKVQPIVDSKPRGDLVVIEESALRSFVPREVKETKEVPQPAPEETSKETPKEEEEVGEGYKDNFEESKSKWKSFAQKKGLRGGVSKLPRKSYSRK